MVTALALKAEGLAHRVGILDFDMHYGNGTDEIITKLGARTWIEHYTAGKNYCYVSQATEFLTRIPRIVNTMSACDVILYQAGADPHIADPLGGWLTTLELRTRDRIVFDEAKRLGVPVAWNLAGSYQRDSKGSIAPVLEIHSNTMRACADVYSS